MIKKNVCCKFSIFVLLILISFSSGCIFDTNDVKADFVSAGHISKETASEVRNYIHNAYNDLPKNEEERDNFTIGIAENICSNAEKIDMNLIEKTGFTEDSVRKLNYVGQILEENFNFNHNEKEFKQVLQLTGSISRYGPIVYSYNSLLDDACTLAENKDDEAMEDFYISCSSLGLDIVLVQQQVAYKAAFAGTGIINNKLGLASIRGICGNRCYAFALSGIHWAVRDNLQNVKTYIIEKSREGDVKININNIDLKDLKKDIESFLPADGFNLPRIWGTA